MRNKIVLLSLFSLILTVMVMSIAATRVQSAAISKITFRQPDLNGWPEPSKKAAMDLIFKYGSPDVESSDMLVWHNNGCWLKTIVYRNEARHYFPVPHSDVVEQWVNCNVPVSKYPDLALYDGSITINRTNGTISSCCSSEEMNTLAINLSHSIIIGIKTCDEARQEYETASSQLNKGIRPVITQQLQFIPAGATNDSDKPALAESKQTALSDKN